MYRFIKFVDAVKRYNLILDIFKPRVFYMGIICIFIYHIENKCTDLLYLLVQIKRYNTIADLFIIQPRVFLFPRKNFQIVKTFSTNIISF